MRVFVARQPVFDQNERIFAYDVALHGAPGDTGHFEESSPERLVKEVFLEIGLDRVAEGHGVLFTANRDMLLRGSLHVLPADRVIIQIPGAVAADAQIVPLATELANAGYRIALQAVDHETPFARGLLDVAQLVNVDVAGIKPEHLPELAAELRGADRRLMAVNVRHAGQREECRKLGFDLFAGFRFSAPETYTRKEIGIEQLLTFRVLKLVRDANASDAEIEDLIRRDVGLSYKLLKIVNSAATGAREIWSIGHALRLLGREQVARWLSVLLVSDGNSDGVRAELMHLSLTRARMCELAAEEAGLRQARGPAFLVGMLSVLDQILEIPMTTICEAMDLAPDLRAALLHRRDFFGEVLQLVESFIAGEWEAAMAAAEKAGVGAARLQPMYLESLAWASAQRQSSVAA
jgi:EAL and modified HD-GYP domain-containing signal transduction protein